MSGVDLHPSGYGVQRLTAPAPALCEASGAPSPAPWSPRSGRRRPG